MVKEAETESKITRVCLCVIKLKQKLQILVSGKFEELKDQLNADCILKKKM